MNSNQFVILLVTLLAVLTTWATFGIVTLVYFLGLCLFVGGMGVLGQAVFALKEKHQWKGITQ